MRILITGITGYIGSNLARALLPAHEVYGLVRAPLNGTYLGEVRERLRLLYYDGSYESVSAALTASRPELVYHMAAYYTGAHGPDDTPALIESNITLGAYLLEALSVHGGSALVYASTVMAHYQGADYRPLNLYAATKRAFSDLLDYYTDAGLLRAVTLVLSDTYGPGDNRPKILNLIQSAIQNKAHISLTSGTQDYDAVYIDDIVRAFLLAGKHALQSDVGKNEIYQVCAQNPLTLRETIDLLLEVNHLRLSAGWGERTQPKREIHRAVRIYPLLPGWEERIPLAEGLKRLWNETVC